MSKRVRPATELLCEPVDLSAEDQARVEWFRHFNELIQDHLLTGVAVSISKSQEVSESPLFQAFLRLNNARAELYGCSLTHEQLGKVTALDIAIAGLLQEAVSPRAREVLGRLAKANDGKASWRLEEIKALSRQLANEFWAEDHSKQVRIGAMAKRVFEALCADKKDGQFVPKEKTLRTWLKDVAPEYATAKGAPRRSAN